MKKLCKFPEIEQFRHAVEFVKNRTQYAGKNENGEPIYDETILLPTLKFGGTVKLHGSNAGITLSRDGEIFPQSREQLLSVTNDNAGFALFVEKNKNAFKSLLSMIDMKHFDYVTIFGEWCGSGIQKGVGISQLERMFVIFDIKLSYDDNKKGDNIYLPEDEIKRLRSTEHRIFNIYDYQTYEIEIDFNDPQKSLDKLTQLTIDVENECPVSKSFGISGIGEGIVWCHQTPDYQKIRFKTKGMKHKGTKSKTKQIVEVDVEKINSINEFVDYSVTEPRLEQGIEKVFGFNQPLDIKRTGDYLRWIVNDIMKEELDVLIKNNLTPKDVNSSISTKARLWFMEKYNKF